MEVERAMVEQGKKYGYHNRYKRKNKVKRSKDQSDLL